MAHEMEDFVAEVHVSEKRWSLPSEKSLRWRVSTVLLDDLQRAPASLQIGMYFEADVYW